MERSRQYPGVEEFDDVARELRYPIAGPQGIRTVLVGGGLLLVAVLLFVLTAVSFVFELGPFPALLALSVVVGVAVALLVGGYLVEVLRATIEGHDEPPDFGDPGKLLANGVVAAAIALGYAAPMLFVVAVPGVLFLTGGLGTEGLTMALITVGMVGFVYSTVLGYVFPIAVCGYVDQGRIGAGFSLSRIRRVGFDEEYLIAWAIGFLLQTFVGNLVGVLYVVVVGFFLQFSLYVVVARIYALGYARSLYVEDRPFGENGRTEQTRSAEW